MKEHVRGNPPFLIFVLEKKWDRIFSCDDFSWMGRRTILQKVKKKLSRPKRNFIAKENQIGLALSEILR